MNISTREEVERCLPHFIRLCVQRAIDKGIALDAAAIEVSRSFYGRFPKTIAPDVREHFTRALSDLVDLASALAPRLSVQMLQDYVARASVDQVAAVLERSLTKSLHPETWRSR